MWFGWHLASEFLDNLLEINNSIMLLCVLQRTIEEVKMGPHGEIY